MIESQVQAAIDQFEIKTEKLNEIVDFFVSEAAKGLAEDKPRTMPMIPTFVTKIPTGKEKGLFLAADLGGSNFRVCSVHLNGDSTHTMKQMKWAVPHEMMVGNADQFWKYLAERTHEFLDNYHLEEKNDHKDKDQKLSMGFTFSFPVHQTGINRGTLIRWTKGYDIKDAVGTDVCVAYQDALDAHGIPVHVASMVNDTVGCLLTRSYETGSNSQTVIGAILGTGSNAAYSDRIIRILKLDQYSEETKKQIEGKKVMIVNTEWGSFDNDLKILPNTQVDKEVNLETPNRDFHMFEKRVSGMFLGEIVRRTLEHLYSAKAIFTEAEIAKDSKFYSVWSNDSSFLSIVRADASNDLKDVGAQLAKLGVPQTTMEERKAVAALSHAIGLRSARLMASVLAGLLKKTRSFEKFDIVDIGVDGAVIEYYPHFEDMIREALREIDAIGPEKEKRITIGLSQDGSGIGGALSAAMTTH